MTAQNHKDIIELGALHNHKDDDEEEQGQGRDYGYTSQKQNGSKFHEDLGENGHGNGFANGNGNGHGPPHEHGIGDEEDYSEGEDDEEALLSGGSQRTRRERSGSTSSLGKGGRLARVWPQIKDIVWEVRRFYFYERLLLPLRIGSADIITDDCRFVIYR